MKYYLVECLIIKDENEYLLEHLQRNYAAGIEHFYIYDNESSTPVVDWLQANAPEWLDKCSITPIPDTSNNRQLVAYNTFLNDHAADTTWCAFVDTDEMFVGNLVSLCQENEEQYAGIYFREFTHGDNGHLIKTEGTQFERFADHDVSLRWPTYKCLVQTNKVERQYPHKAEFKNKSSKVKIMGYHQSPTLHHFITRSWEEYQNKQKRGAASTKNKKYGTWLYKLLND